MDILIQGFKDRTEILTIIPKFSFSPHFFQSKISSQCAPYYSRNENLTEINYAVLGAKKYANFKD